MPKIKVRRRTYYDMYGGSRQESIVFWAARKIVTPFGLAFIFGVELLIEILSFLSSLRGLIFVLTLSIIWFVFIR